MGNVLQEQIAIKKPQHILSFQAINVTGTDGTLNVAADTNVAVTQRVMPFGGSVYAQAVNLSGTITTGTLTAYPTINGATLTNLATQLGIPGDQYDYTSGDGRVNNFVPGDRVGVVFVADTVAPDANRDMFVDVYILQEGVEL